MWVNVKQGKMKVSCSSFKLKGKESKMITLKQSIVFPEDHVVIVWRESDTSQEGNVKKDFYGRVLFVEK